jgi:ribonuclease HI
MRDWQVYTDASVNTQSKVGYGAYLVVSEPSACLDSLKDTVKIRRFEQSTSSKLELQTLLWALDEIIPLLGETDIALTVYTDCQTIITLPDRQSSLEQRNYLSSKHKRLNNYELYQRFYAISAKLPFSLIKVAGHQPASKKNQNDRRFALVDQASRRALRKEFSKVCAGKSRI